MRILPFVLVLTLAPLPLHAVDGAQTPNTCTTCPASQFRAQSVAQDAQAPEGTLVEATFLGLITEPISLERAGDLGLPAGTGLSVVRVAPDSPASKAGFQMSDVLTKLDDQLLVNPAQLRVLVRAHGAADTLTFQVVRKGKGQAIKTGLGTRKMPELSPGGEEPRMFFPQSSHGQPGTLAIPFSHGDLPPEILKQLPKQWRERMDRMRRAPESPKTNAQKETDDDSNDDTSGNPSDETIPLEEGALNLPSGLTFSSRVVSSDDAHTLEIEHGSREHLRITTKDGKELFNGALPKNDKEWEKVPQEVRAKAKALAAKQTFHGDGVKKQDSKNQEKAGQSF